MCCIVCLRDSLASVCIYRSRSRVRDLSSVFLPLRTRVLVLHVRSLKSFLDFRQSEPTHCRRLHVFPKDINSHNEKDQSASREQ